MEHASLPRHTPLSLFVLSPSLVITPAHVAPLSRRPHSNSHISCVLGLWLFLPLSLSSPPTISPSFSFLFFFRFFSFSFSHSSPRLLLPLLFPSARFLKSVCLCVVGQLSQLACSLALSLSFSFSRCLHRPLPDCRPLLCLLPSLRLSHLASFFAIASLLLFLCDFL